jgi:hypothetical protein
METLKGLKKMLECFEEENRFYWVESLRKSNVITAGQAGWLCVELGLL